MTDNNRPTLAEIKASHAPKVVYERFLPVSRFIFRPPSFYAIWLLVRLGVSGEAASWLSGLSALAGFVLLLWPSGPLLWPGILMLMLFNFFDCLDGGIARITGAQNPYGRFLDSIMWWADMLFWMVIGLVLWRVPGLRQLGDSFGIAPWVWIASGVACAYLVTYAAYLDSVFDQALSGEWTRLISGGADPAAPTPLAGKHGPEFAARVFVHNMRVRETHYVLLALACAIGCADLLLAGMLCFNMILVLLLLTVYCARGRKVRADVLGRRKPV